ncbi:MAG: hypothetical protein DRH26_03620 [Deltaproteobacteria bacterium]|nr:MAG: hypothetical protein DRH26_03620 [Deltaproteobacteria bacterium]
MRHAIYGDDPSSASIAILVKESSFHSYDIKEAYIDYLGANPKGFIAYSLWYDDNNKCQAALAKDYLQTLLLSIKQQGIKTLLVTDAKYFKFITGQQKAASNFIGYAVSSQIKNYEDEFTVFYAPNYLAAKFNPKTGEDFAIALQTFQKYLKGSYIEPGQSIIHTAQYPDNFLDTKKALKWLMDKPALTIDIEAKGLEFWNCGIATIAFAWDKHNFISIPVDRGDFAENAKMILGWFFDNYKGKLIPHNANFDFKVLVYELWMDNLQDYHGMIQGIEVLTKNFDDTKIIAYLATNNAVENVLKLKVLAAEYMGNYAKEEIKDTTKISLPKLLEYNGKDTLATWFIHNKYQPIMVADGQQKIYEEIFKPSVITLLQTELVGMPIFPEKVAAAKKKLVDLQTKYTSYLHNSKLIQEFQLDVKSIKCQEFTDACKKKVFDMNDPKVVRLVFNPNSNQQVGNLLYTYLGLPILDLTDTKQPAVGKKTLKKLLNHTTNAEYKEIISSLIGLTQVDKILTSFIPPFENAVEMPDGSFRLYGNFNLGGTVSGRLSCVAGWTPIITDRGNIPIANIIVGDKVWTHKEQWEPVTNTIYKGVDHMVNITLCTGEVFTCTIDHKVLLSSGEWKSIKEILNVNFKSMGKRPNKYNQNCKSVSVDKISTNNGTNSKRIGYNFSQCFSRIKTRIIKNRVSCNQGSKILRFQVRGQESHERKNRGASSQLERGMFRLQRLSDRPVQWETGICSSDNNDGTSKFNRVAREHDCTSYRQQSIKQCIRQSCIDFQNRTQADTSLAGKGQSTITIKKIEYFGCTDVYDITVANSSSYLSCGFYSHNSSNPNLTNIPSNSMWGKLIKACFGCIKGWLYGGADFNSLEDMISALTTRDINKMKVYIDGYDGHSLRAFSYFKDQMPDIVETVKSINSIKTLYPQVRQASKEPTFLLTYQGTYHGLMNSLGLEEDAARRIEDNFLKLYKESVIWIADKLQQACDDGYVTGAFGLRLRTPLLKMNGRGKLQYKAAAEGRTAGNMLGQSYGMLNSRAANKFREKIWASKYKYDVLLCGQIHDSIYLIWKNTAGITKWVNDNIIDCMNDGGLVELQHPTVKVGAELDIFYPDWSKATTLKNGISIKAIVKQCKLP